MFSLSAIATHSNSLSIKHAGTAGRFLNRNTSQEWNRTWKWCLESKFPPPLFLNCAYFLRLTFFGMAHSHHSFGRCFDRFFVPTLSFNNVLTLFGGEAFGIFWTQLSFDAGNLTRLLSFQNAGFHLVNPQPGGQPIFGGGGSPMILVPDRCCSHFLSRSTTFPFSHHQSSPTHKKSSADGFSHAQQG